MARRIVITGGSGFPGTHLLRRLLSDRYDVVSFDVAQTITHTEEERIT